MTKRIMIAIGLVLVGCGGALAACSGETTTGVTGPDSGTDAAPQDASRPDAPTTNDAGTDANTPADSAVTDSAVGGDGAPVNCGGKTCTGSNVCCVVQIPDGGIGADCFAGGCPDGGPAVQCDGPAQCTAQKPICCAHLEVGAGRPPNCPLNSVSSACQSQCTTNLSFTCPASETVRLCGQKSDCAGDPQNPNCCTFQQGSQQVTFCASDLVAQAGTCHQ